MRRDAKVAKRDVSDTELKQVFGSVDIDGGGEIDIDEFVAWINTDDKPEDIVLETPSPRRRRRVSRMHTCTHTCMHTQPAGCTVLLPAAASMPRSQVVSCSSHAQLHLLLGRTPLLRRHSKATRMPPQRKTAYVAGSCQRYRIASRSTRAQPSTPASRSSRRKKPAKVQALELQRKQVPDTPLVKQVKIKLKAAACVPSHCCVLCVVAVCSPLPAPPDTHRTVWISRSFSASTTVTIAARWSCPSSFLPSVATPRCRRKKYRMRS